MKCKHCDGVGFFENGASQFKCVYCDGTGEVEQTEQEYIQTCNTEQLAEWLQEHMDCSNCDCNKDICYQGYDCCKLAFVEWLKQPHTDKE